MRNRSELIADVLCVLLTLAVVAVLACVARSAAPVPPNLPPGQPDLRGLCTWGKVAQHDDVVTISGSVWHGEGRIVDGVLHFSWLCGDRPAQAEYRIDGKTLTGEWGWAGEAARVPERIEIREARVEGPEL